MDNHGVIRLEHKKMVKRAGWMVWESLAFIALAVAVAHLALPMLDGLLNPKGEEEIVIRAYVNEVRGFNPDTITLERGTKVKLVIISMDVVHSFVVPGLGIDTGMIRPGERKEVEITVDKPGVYEFRCGIVCSPEHPFMIGKIIVKG